MWAVIQRYATKLTISQCQNSNYTLVSIPHSRVLVSTNPSVQGLYNFLIPCINWKNPVAVYKLLQARHILYKTDDSSKKKSNKNKFWGSNVLYPLHNWPLMALKKIQFIKPISRMYINSDWFSGILGIVSTKLRATETSEDISILAALSDVTSVIRLHYFSNL